MAQRHRYYLLMVGGIVGIHWVLFFLSIHISSISTALIGVATGSFWTALLEPLLLKKSIKSYEIILGFLIMLGIWVVLQADGVIAIGLFCGIISAFLSAFFSILNVKAIRMTKSVLLITQYEMIGAFLTVLILSPFINNFLDTSVTIDLSLVEVAELLILALVCTVYPYAHSVELLKRLSAYSINLAVNLEPVYGILLAFIFFNEQKNLSSHFFYGTSIILFAIFLDTFFKYLKKKKRI